MIDRELHEAEIAQWRAAQTGNLQEIARLRLEVERLREALRFIAASSELGGSNLAHLAAETLGFLPPSG